jgi:hypothetical protein
MSWARATAALARVDYMLTYALVGFVGRVFERYFSRSDTLVVAAVVIGVTARGAGGQTGGSLRRVSAVLIANGVLAGMPAASATETSATVLVLHWLLSTSTVILLPTLAAPFTEEQVLTQISRIVLFAYAENAMFLTQMMHTDYVLAALAALVLHAARGGGGGGGAVGIATRALGMLATNVIVTALMRGTAGDALEIAVLLSALVLLDHLQPWLEAAGELRDYAAWKASALITTRLAGAPRDAVLGALGAAIGVACGAQSALGKRLRYDAIIDVGILVMAGVVISAVETTVRAMPSSLVWVVLLAVVNVVHVVLGAAVT